MKNGNVSDQFPQNFVVAQVKLIYKKEQNY